MTKLKQPTTAVLLASLLGACAADEVAQPSAETAPPADVKAELVETALEALRAEPRIFSVVVTEEGGTQRAGELALASADPERPVFKLTLNGEEPLEVASDGETVYAGDSAGIVTSRWDRAGMVLFSDRAGKILPTLLNPSSFATYDGEVSRAEDGRTATLRSGLPNGGAWNLTVDTESGLPRSLSFQGSADANLEKVEIEPVDRTVPSDSATFRLAPADGERAEEFFAGPAPGELAPDVTFELVDGTSVELADLRGSVVVFDFWATWCVPCRPAMQELELLHREYADDGLRVFGLRLFDYGDPTAFLESVGATYPMGDGQPFAELYGVASYGLPTLYVIDRQGKIVDLAVGFKAGVTEAKVAEAVRRALGSPT